VAIQYINFYGSTFSHNFSPQYNVVELVVMIDGSRGKGWRWEWRRRAIVHIHVPIII